MAGPSPLSALSGPSHPVLVLGSQCFPWAGAVHICLLPTYSAPRAGIWAALSSKISASSESMEGLCPGSSAVLTVEGCDTGLTPHRTWGQVAAGGDTWCNRARTGYGRKQGVRGPAKHLRMKG